MPVLKHSPDNSIIPFKRLNSCQASLDEGIEVSRNAPHSFDTWIPSFKPSQKEFNLLNGTIKLPGECLSPGV